MNDPHDFRKVEAFADLDDDQIRWLAEHARIVTLDAGEALAHEGDVADTLFAVLEGELRLRREKGAPDDRWIVRPAGKITGALPLSRLTHSPVTARALIPTRVAAFPPDLVTEMLERIPVLHARLAAIMLDRSREFTRHEEQRERLVSLGKLSAGLAHELNNPAAAIQRRVDELSRRLDDLSRLAAEGLDRESTPTLSEAMRALVHAKPAPDHHARDALERSDAQDALGAWLEARGLPDAWLAAETLVSAGVSVEDIEPATRDVPEAAVRSAVRWIEADLAARRLLDDIAEASRRIVDLISAAKSYSNLDRAPTRGPTDVNEGIRSTLAMLTHKVRSKDIVLETELDPGLPQVTANAGELNQVWTNLVDNAIDAASSGGTVAIRTSSGNDGAGDGVTVRVRDDGPGIPADVQRHMFEPFFTTKDVGEGTGLGLDIVRRIVRAHGGEVHVESVPGRTSFEVRLPSSKPDAAPARD